MRNEVIPVEYSVCKFKKCDVFILFILTRDKMIITDVDNCWKLVSFIANAVLIYFLFDLHFFVGTADNPFFIHCFIADIRRCETEKFVE